MNRELNIYEILISFAGWKKRRRCTVKRVLDDSLIYEILSAVEEIPAGKVASYGQIAALVGREKNARLVGKVLSNAKFYGAYPCHRVVNHAGRTAPGWPEQRSPPMSS